ncbi:MAG: lytic transglycosylase domain-containing protein [Alphaproteobacteria bacterium]
MIDTVYRPFYKIKSYAPLLAVCAALLCAICGLDSRAAFAQQQGESRLMSQNTFDRTVQAFRLVEQNKWDQARQMVLETRDPLAAKLFFWLSYTRQERDLDFVSLTQFIRQNPGWPGLDGLRTKAERLVPDNLPARNVIAWFDDYPPLSARGADRYLTAILETGNTAKARSYLSDWWANASLSRDDQRNLFRKYNMYINTAAHHKRLDMLLLRGQNDNALAIANVLKQGYPELANARIALAQEAGNVNTLIRMVPRHLQNDPGLLYERLRWRRRSNMTESAIEILQQKPSIDKIQNPAEWWLERHIIIRRLLEQKNYRLAYQLAAGHKLTEGLPFAQAEWMAGWIALRFLSDSRGGYAHFQKLYENVSSPISKSRAAYWAGRALLAMGENDRGRNFYQDAAQFRTTFYGQLAAAELSIKGEILSAAPPVLSAADKEQFHRDEMIQAARLFHRADMRNTASRFLRTFVSHHNSAKAYVFAADMAIEFRSLQDAINISKDATNNGLFLTAQSYPLIVDQLRGTNLEWALVHSLIRQESVFNATARSPAGALGLMQVMPATGAETARKLGIQHSTDWLISRPAHNIRIGTYYLEQLLKRYDGAYPLAVAAYNAGPGRVDNWLRTFGDPRKGEIDIIDFIELMPIYETRNYVHRVLEGTYVYRLRLRNTQGQRAPQTVSLANPINLRD